MNEKPLLKFKIPNVKEIEGYAVKLPDGSIVVRSKDELKPLKKGGTKSEPGKQTGS